MVVLTEELLTGLLEEALEAAAAAAAVLVPSEEEFNLAGFVGDLIGDAAMTEDAVVDLAGEGVAVVVVAAVLLLLAELLGVAGLVALLLLLPVAMGWVSDTMAVLLGWVGVIKWERRL